MEVLEPLNAVSGDVMTFYKSKPDSKLPLLTQFFQLSMPKQWQVDLETIEETLPAFREMERLRGGRPDSKQTTDLFETELDRWLLRAIAGTGIPVVPGGARVPLPEFSYKEPKLYYSHMFYEGVRGHAVPTLESFGYLHQDLWSAMSLLANPSLKGPKTERSINLILNRINVRMARVSMGIRLVYAPESYVVTEYTSVSVLENWLLVDFCNAATRDVGSMQALTCCKECSSIFVKIKQDNPYCSHRCYDRVGHRQKATLKKQYKNL